MATSSYVTISVYRNRAWLQPFAVFNADGSALDVSGDDLALTVIPAGADLASGQIPVFSSLDPFVEVNTVAFTVSDATMGTLDATLNYDWQFIRRNPAGSGADNYSVVLAAGPLLVSDSPPFPS